MVNNSSGTNTSGNLFQTSLTADGVLYADGSKVISSTAAGTAGQVLQSAGAGVAPAYSTATFPATAGTSGTLLQSNGTNIVNTTATYPTTTTANRILYSSATSVVGEITTANSGVLATSSAGAPSINTNIAIATGGQVTMASQPSFSVYNLNNVTSVTGDGTAYTVNFDTELADVGGNFASSTFTAPVTGNYLFCGEVTIYNLGVAHTQALISIITISNNIAMGWQNSALTRELASGNNILGIPFCVVVPMAATNTASIQLEVSGSTKTVNLFGGKGCIFSGQLLS